MNIGSKMMKLSFLYILLSLPAAPGYAAAPEDTIAVLSVESGVYMEAFSAFQAAYGGEVAHYDLSRQKPELAKDTRLVVAFGGKAASYPYPAGLNVVYCLAPGVFSASAEGVARTTKISLIPDFSVTFAKLKKIQPGLRRLWLLWVVPENNPLAKEVKEEGARQGIQVTTARLENQDALPAALRRTMGAADAIWLAPDPQIVTPQTLRLMKEFSWENGIPFYGSTKSMTREGAVASLGVSFAEMGKAAAKAALALERGEPAQRVAFPEKIEITLNASAAAKLGIVFPGSILDEAGCLFP